MDICVDFQEMPMVYWNALSNINRLGWKHKSSNSAHFSLHELDFFLVSNIIQNGI
jgi:hypothetical protein